MKIIITAELHYYERVNSECWKKNYDSSSKFIPCYMMAERKPRKTNKQVGLNILNQDRQYQRNINKSSINEPNKNKQ